MKCAHYSMRLNKSCGEPAVQFFRDNDANMPLWGYCKKHRRRMSASEMPPDWAEVSADEALIMEICEE
jgi:hypothetical protein